MFFHKLYTGFKRKFFSRPVETVSEQKWYGNKVESELGHALKKDIQGCHIKSNILVNTGSGSCEIDILLMYQNKLFLIEIKHWKGYISEEYGEFISRKEDRYTGEIHEKTLKSPFRQIKRQVMLLKEQTDTNPWINTIVFFADADKVDIYQEDTWFDDYEALVKYIKTGGAFSRDTEREKCFDRAVQTDFIYSPPTWGERSLHCLISEGSLEFITEDKRRLEKSMMARLEINHHFSYDDITVYLKDGTIEKLIAENSEIRVMENGYYRNYSLARISTIIIGN